MPGSRLNSPVRMAGLKSEFWDPKLDRPVNKCDLSTRENGEFRPEGAHRQFVHGLRTDESNRRERTRKTITHAECLEYRAPFERIDAVNKMKLKFANWKSGSPAWIRTTIHGSKGRCPTIR